MCAKKINKVKIQPSLESWTQIEGENSIYGKRETYLIEIQNVRGSTTDIFSRAQDDIKILNHADFFVH